MHLPGSAHSAPLSARVWLAGLLLALSACGANAVTPGVGSDTTSSRIINGVPVPDLPAVGQFGGCTGTVIAPRTVLTAAHCLEGHVASDFSFNIGSNAFSPDFELGVAAIAQHPGFDGETLLDNDIGLLTLSQDAPVQPVALINGIDASWVGTSLLFMGYGAIDGTTRAGQGLKREVNDNISSITDARIRFGNDGNGICYGDSGGPGMFVDSMGTHFIVSVTSYTELVNGTAACAYYSDATRVDDYFSFIGVAGQAPVLAAPAPAPDTCQGETHLGRCVANVLHFCGDTNQPEVLDCTANNATCGWSYSNQFYACLTNPNTSPTPTPTVTSSPAPGTTPTPTPTATATPNPAPTATSTPVPVSTPTPTPMPSYSTGGNTNGLTHVGGSPARTTSAGCGGETFQGRCQNNTVVWCESGTTLVQDDCNAAGAYCAYNSRVGYYDCVSPAVSH